MTNEVVLYGDEETPRQQRFIQEYFNADHWSNEEYLDCQVMQTTYTGGETVNVKKFLSRSESQNGVDEIRPIWLWGVFCYPKERLNTETGELEPRVGIIFRLGTPSEPTELFLSFESVAATNFVKRSILPMIKREMIGVGDWTLGIPIAVWEVPAKIGHSFRFRLLSSKEV